MPISMSYESARYNREYIGRVFKRSDVALSSRDDEQKLRFGSGRNHYIFYSNY